MANFESPGTKKRILIICAALALFIPLLLLAQGDKDKGNKGGGNKGGKSSMCQTVTADAEFRDNTMDGIRGDGNYSSIYGDKMYYGLEDALVCLLTEQDHDFILSTEGKTSYERASGIDRKVTLDFGANGNPSPPFDSLTLEVDALIRVDEVLSDSEYTNPEMRFLLWFDVGRDSYQLRFDGTDCDLVSVTQSGASSDRMWTIESTGNHVAWLVKLKGVSRKTTVGYFKMPFQITVYETEKDPTCL